MTKSFEEECKEAGKLYRQGKISQKKYMDIILKSNKEILEQIHNEAEDIVEKCKKDEAKRALKRKQKWDETVEKAKKRSVRSAQNKLNRAFLGLDKYGIPIHPRYNKNRGKNYPLPSELSEFPEIEEE